MHIITGYLNWLKCFPSGRHGPRVCSREAGDCCWTDDSETSNWTATHDQGESRSDITFWAWYGNTTKIRTNSGLNICRWNKAQQTTNYLYMSLTHDTWLILLLMAPLKSIRYVGMQKQSVAWSRPSTNFDRVGKPESSSWRNSLPLLVSHNRD